MKNKWKWVYNPFEFVAGWKAFGFGIVILVITTVLGYFGNTVFYGISASTIPDITWNMAFFLQATGLATTVALMYIAALIFAKHVRFQDILGTVTLAKYPLVLMSLLFLAFNEKIKSLAESLLASIDFVNNKLTYSEIVFSDFILLIAIGVISLLLLIWTIVLLYNAFRVSTNLKGIKCGVLFTAIILVSEIVIQLLKSLMC